MENTITTITMHIMDGAKIRVIDRMTGPGEPGTATLIIESDGSSVTLFLWGPDAIAALVDIADAAIRLSGKLPVPVK